MVLMQNCKITNASSNSTAVLTEYDILGAALERPNLQNLEEEACPASTWWFGRHYEYGVLTSCTYVHPRLGELNSMLVPNLSFCGHYVDLISGIRNQQFRFLI